MQKAIQTASTLMSIVICICTRVTFCNRDPGLSLNLSHETNSETKCMQCKVEIKDCDIEQLSIRDFLELRDLPFAVV